MAFSREIIKKVLQYVRFRVPQTEEKNSYYTEIGNTLVRVSNHCTWLYRWDEILEKNPKWKGKPIVSIVFEDSGNTFSDKCLVLRRFRMKPIKVVEYVYPLQGNPQFITPQDERLIINGIKQIQGGKYTDLTNKCSEPILRISQNPPDVPPTQTMNNNENKQYNTNMNKKLIRLTESDLHRIVKESVNRVITELDWRTYANAAKKSREQASADWDRAKENPSDYSHYYDYDKHTARARNFDNAASQMLDKQYGGRHSVSTEDPHIQWLRRYPESEIDVSHDAYRPLKGYEEDWPAHSTTTHDNYHIGNKEISDFAHGKSKYVKGKGWQ